MRGAVVFMGGRGREFEARVYVCRESGNYFRVLVRNIA